MKQTLVNALALLLTLSLFAQDTPQNPPAVPATPPSEEAPQEPVATPAANDIEGPARAPAVVLPLFTNTIGAGLQTFDVNTASSKFEEYRDVPEGIAGPEFRLFRADDPVRVLATGERLGQDDRRFDVSVEHSAVAVEAYFDQIPHRLGNEARSILVRASKDAWGLNDVTQRALQDAIAARRAQNAASVNFAFLSGLVEPLTAAPYVYDLGYDRLRAGVSVQPFPEAALDTRVTYFREKRDGTRPVGSSFGFGNVVETGEPIEYVTEEAGVSMELPLSRGLVRGGVMVHQFTNELQSYTFDNPFRITDSTDANAYQAPGSGSVNGPSFGRMSLAPDSDQLLLTLGGVFRLPMRSRLTADVAWSHLVSNERLIPFATNTAMLTPSGLPAFDPGSLPDSQFNGEIDTLRTTVSFNSRPVAGLGLNAKLRFYDLDNESERIRFEEGYARFDSAWNPTGRITVPYGWTNTRFDLYGTYDLGMATLEAGFRHDAMERTFRETEETTENIVHLATDLRPFSWAVFRASYEFGKRDFDQYDSERGEHASFLGDVAATNLPELRRYDQAERDTSRIVGMVQLMPLESVALSANYVRYFDDYSEYSTHGLQTWRNNSMTLEGDYTPSARWNVFAFFSHDEWSGFQRGRQSAGTPNPDPLDDWTSLHIDKSNTYGLGANVSFIPDRLGLKVNGSLQKVSGFNNLESPPGGSIVNFAVDVPSIDDTGLLSITAELKYAFSSAWHFAFGAWHEDYEIFDQLSTGTRAYMPAAFFLIPNDADYEGTAIYVRTNYQF
jgi:MtrB/PioB family decaheme-associated outer membrane protein